MKRKFEISLEFESDLTVSPWIMSSRIMNHIGYLLVTNEPDAQDHFRVDKVGVSCKINGERQTVEYDRNLEK